jgi:PAS domain S-box-containing protein
MERSRSETDIDETLAQSFPASDPPSWTLGDEPAAPPIEGDREMAHHAHEWLCTRIVDEAQDAIILADRDGVIRLWNSGAEAVFGHRAEEALGRSLDLIIPERLRARHWAGYRDTMATGATRYANQVLAVPAIRKDGASISVEFTIVLLRDATGTLLGPAAIIRDVTARWERDRELKKRLAALETKAPGG